jgi:hypothetical protein
MENDDFLAHKMVPPQWLSVFMKKFKKSVENEKVAESQIMKKVFLAKLIFVNKKLIFSTFCEF